jgi:electron transport complex protein RnfD
LGRNIFNPALAGRAFLMAAWPKYMTTFTRPFIYDAVTQATPLSLIKEGKASGVVDLGLSYWDLLIGNRGGALGEVCILALLLGGRLSFIQRHHQLAYPGQLCGYCRCFHVDVRFPGWFRPGGCASSGPLWRPGPGCVLHGDGLCDVTGH